MKQQLYIVYDTARGLCAYVGYDREAMERFLETGDLTEAPRIEIWNLSESNTEPDLVLRAVARTGYELPELPS